MPIEIKELHIKINVNKEGEQKGDSGSEDKDKLVKECLEQVISVINNKNER